MKNYFKIIALFLVGSLSLTSCSSSDDSAASNQFQVDGQSYEVLPSNGLVELKMDNIYTDQGQSFDRSTVSLVGVNGTTVASVAFDLFYKDGLPVEGTYSIAETLDDYSPDFYDQLLTDEKLCLGWTSLCAVNQGGSTLLINANNPIGTVTVTNNGNNNFTIQYNGNFRKYNSNFEVIGTVPVVINITSDLVSP